VIVDAVVADRKGLPVASLTAADFEILDEGQPQTIQLFQTISAAAAAGAGAAPARRFAYATNVGVDARPTRAFVLFFDDVQLTQGQGDRAKAALTGFLEREARDGDLVSLVAPGRALRWHARLPEGRGELMRIVGSLKGLFLPDLTTERMSDYEAYRIHVFQDEAVAAQVDRRWQNFRVLGREPTNPLTDKGFQPENRGGNIGIIKQDIAIRAAAVYGQAAARNRTTLLSIARTLDGLATVRGRKSLILMSPGFIEDQERRESRVAIEAARQANVALYFVDARGLETGTPFAQAQYGSPLDPRDLNAANADLTLGAEGAETLSVQTGGFSVRNRNDLDSALGRIGRESGVYYLIGYQPAGPSKTGVYRRIEVKVKRPEVQVRARRGYYAGGTAGRPAAESEPSLGDDLARATESPYELSAIPLRGTAYVFGQADPGKAVVMMAVESDLRAFDLKPKDGRLVDQLDLRIVVTRQETGASERSERQVEMSFPATARFSADAWHTLTEEFRLEPGRYQARMAVRDRNSGRIGAITHGFEVPTLDGLRVTTPILTDTIETPSPSSQAAPKPVLVVRRTFPAGTTLYYQFSVLGAGLDGSSLPRVVAGHEIRRADGASIRRMEPRPIAGSNTQALSRFSGVSLTGVPPGDYDLVLRIADEVRAQSIELREPFSILPLERMGASDGAR
jgi:VWFA-related protein